MLHGHGDDGYRYGRTLRANFSSNVRPDGPPPALLAHLRECLPEVASYPPAAAEPTTARLAAQHGIEPEEVMLTAGATAGIYLIAQAWRGARSRVVVPAFAEYEDAARLHAHAVDFALEEAVATSPVEAADVMWLCNPNNPTGTVHSREALLHWIDGHPQTVFVIDTAYAAFAVEAPVRPSDAVARPNLVLLGSFTKEYGIPGLRVGWLAARADQLRRIRAGAVPWAVGALELAAATYCIRHATTLRFDGPTWLEQARRWQRDLAAVPGVTVHPRGTPYFLLALQHGTAADCKRYLIKAHGLLVRDASNFRGLGPRFVRLATQRAEANRWLVEALGGWKP